MEQLREAKLLASEDDDDETAKGDRFERLFRMLLGGMPKERGWTPEIPEDSQCLAGTGVSETREGTMPELKELESKLEDCCLVLQIFGSDGYDEAPIFMQVLSGKNLSILFAKERFLSPEIMVPFSKPFLLASPSVLNDEAADVLLCSLLANVHLIRRNTEDQIQGICIHESATMRGGKGSSSFDHDSEGNKILEFLIPGIKIPLERGAKDCFDRLEHEFPHYLPDLGISVEMGLTFEIRTQVSSVSNHKSEVAQSAKTFDVVAKTFDLLPQLHCFEPSCGHSKCRACIDDTANGRGEYIDDFRSLNDVTFAHILDNAKGWNS